MADYQARIAPFIDIEFVVTSEWWEQPRNHRGMDLATYYSAGTNVPLYSMCDGEVVHVGYDATGYGNYLIMKDGTTGMGFLYGHLRDVPLVSVGDSVRIGQQVGIEGTTGSSTGIHLHLEMQDISEHDWIYRAPKEVYTNPADFMGIPNVEGITVYYDGTPLPPGPQPGPTGETKKRRFKFVLFERRRRSLGL